METTQNQVHGSNDANSLGPVEEKARDLGRRVDSASARLHHSWGDATSVVKNRIGTTGERLKYRLQVAGEKAKQKLTVARQRTAIKARSARANVETQVQEHPIKSLAIALGTGAFIGLMLRRTRR